MSVRELKDLLGLRGQLVLLVSSVIVGSALSVGFYLTEKIESVYLEELTRRGSQLAENLAYNSKFATLVGAHDELEELAEGVLRDSSVIAIRFYDVEMGLLYSSVTDAFVDSMQEVSPLHFENDVRLLPTAIHHVDIHGKSHLHLSSPIQNWESDVELERLGSLSSGKSAYDKGHWTTLGRAVIVMDLKPVHQTIANVKFTASLITLFIIMLTIAVTVWFVRLMVRPIKVLAEVTNQISRGHLDKKLDIRRNDEIGKLAHAFDRMVDSLKESRSEVERYQLTLEDKIRERTSELEEAQNQLLQSEKMSAVGQLAAGVAHELNNPLAGILGYSQFALEKLRDRTAESMTERDIVSFTRYLNDIEKQARRCKTIVQNLLRFSRSTQDVDVSPFNLNEAVEETAELMRHQLEMSQISLESVYDQSIPEIIGNAGKIQQVITNLLINALHASSRGDTIRIITKHSPTLGEFDGAAEIIVEDEGIGISEETIGRIFEPFFTTKEIGKGTGLGLSVSYGIIRDHGGEIKVNSVEGAGAQFCIILPLQRKAERADK